MRSVSHYYHQIEKMACLRRRHGSQAYFYEWTNVLYAIVVMSILIDAIEAPFVASISADLAWISADLASMSAAVVRAAAVSASPSC